MNYWELLHVEKDIFPAPCTKDHFIDLIRFAEVAFYVTESWHSLCKRKKLFLLRKENEGVMVLNDAFNNISVIS